MSRSRAKLRLVSSKEPEFSRDALAAAFRDTMTDHIRAHTAGTNVNPETLLTTDYLNHFSEAVMLLELLPAAPKEIAGDLLEWMPESYETHFSHSGFRDKALALAGYRNAPESVRVAFDSAADELSRELVKLLDAMRGKMKSGDMTGLTALGEKAVPRLQDLIGTLAGIINGEDSGAQSAVDALFE